MSSDRHPKLARHLEYLGYESRWQEDGWLYATHPVRWNLCLKPFDDGIRFFSAVQIGALSALERVAWLEFLNGINDETHVARFALVHDPTTASFDVRARTVAPGEYRRREFGIWLDMWHRDLERLRDAPSVHTSEHETDGAKQEVTVN